MIEALPRGPIRLNRVRVGRLRVSSERDPNLSHDGIIAVPFNLILEGEWAGWHLPETDPFEVQAGPFYCRKSSDGTRLCAFRATRSHLNGSNAVHGGCLMTFADFALFWIAYDELQNAGAVTASFSSEFIDSAREGDLVEATGEVLRSTRSMIFARGLISSGHRPLLSFSAILKKTTPRS
jgi:uncharacterized protein (TIGR00369 family)